MHPRVTVAVVLVVLVVTAGCFGGGATDTPVTETTGAPDTPAGPFDGVSQPPGIDDSGVTDADALLSAHESALAGESTTVSMSFTLTVNGTGQNVSLQGKVLPDGDRGWMRVTFPDGTGTYYTADDSTYYRERVNGTTSYGTTSQVSAIPAEPRFGADQRIRTALAAAEWEPVGTVERDGRTLVELRATSVDPPDVNTSGDTTVDSSGRLLVDGEGVVHYVVVETTVENDRGTVEYAIEVRLADVGSTTLEEPDWIDRAR